MHAHILTSVCVQQQYTVAVGDKGSEYQNLMHLAGTRGTHYTVLVHDHKQTVGSEVSPTGRSKQIEYDVYEC